MSLDYYHMLKVHNHVFSVPPGRERNRRLSELTEEEDSELYNFSMGLLSGRIREPKNVNKREVDEKMNTQKRITNFEEFKKVYGKTSGYGKLRLLNQSNPELYQSFKERLERERLKESDPVAYYLRYVANSAE